MNGSTTVAERMDVLHKHQAADWRQDTDYDINLDEATVMARDLRTLAGLIRLFPSEEVSDLADDLLCVSAAKLKAVGKHITLWSKFVRAMDGDAQMDVLKERMTAKYPEGAPHKSLTRRTAASMRLALQTLRQEAMRGHRTRASSAEFIAATMVWAAAVVDWCVCWLGMLLRHAADLGKAENAPQNMDRGCVLT